MSDSGRPISNMEQNFPMSGPSSPQLISLPPPTISDNEAEYPSGLLNAPSIRIGDFEEVTIINGDDSNADVESPNIRSHQASARSAEDERSASPPSSIKAFATARRRPRREMPLPDFDLDLEEGGARAMSVSNRSHNSKTPTGDYRPGSNLNNSANDDQKRDIEQSNEDGTGGGDNSRSENCKEDLYIDFEFLEQFMLAERVSRQNALMQNDDTPGIDADVVVSSPDPESEKLRKIQRGGRALDLNRFSFFSTVWESTIHASELANLVQDGESFRSLFEHPRDEHCVWWLNCNNPTKEEVQGLCKAFGIHPLTVEDIITHEAREKIELVSSYYFASFQSFHTLKHGDGVDYERFNMYVIVFREGVLSFSFVPNPHAASVRRKITTLKEYISLSSDWICYALMQISDNIVDNFGPVIRQLELEVDSIDDSVFLMRDRDSSEFLKRIGTARKNCMALIRLIGGKADVLRSFTKRCNESYPNAPHTDIGIYLSDIQDHVVTMTTNIIHFEQILARAHSNYLATVSVMSISQGNNTNRMLNKITLLASILVPLNLVGAIFGMNIPVPLGTVERDNLGPFFSIIGFMALFTAFMLGLGRYHGLI